MPNALIALVVSLLPAHAQAHAAATRLFRAADGTEYVLRETTGGPAVTRQTGGTTRTWAVRARRDDVGAATDFTFAEADWILHIPDVARPRGLGAGGSPRLIDPTRGRVELTEVTAAADRRTPPAEVVRRPSAGNHSTAMIHFLLPDTDAVAGRLAVFEAESSELRPAHFTFNESLGAGGHREITMWTARDWVPRLATRVIATFGVNPRVRRKLVDEFDRARVVVTCAPGATPLTDRVIAFGRDLDALEAAPDAPAAGATIKLLREHLLETERLLRQVREVAARLGRYTHAAMAQADLETDFEKPILALMRRGFAAIHRIGGPAAVDEMLYGWPLVSGFPQTYLDREVSGQSATYFDHWVMDAEFALTLVPTAVARVGRGDARARVETYRALGAYPLRLANWAPADKFVAWPVYALGLTNGEVARARLHALILDADRASEAARRELGDVDGAEFAAELLEAIATGVERSYERNYAGFMFRPAPYYARAARLFADLIEDARFVLTNRATYLLLLSNATRLQHAIQEGYPRGRARLDARDGEPDLDRESVRLQNALARDQARLVFALSKGCEDDLRPR